MCTIPGTALADAIHIVQRKAHSDPGLVAAGLLAGLARKEADGVACPTRRRSPGWRGRSLPIGQQQHHRGDAPGHADHRDGRAAAVVEHRLPRLAEYVLEHGRTPFTDQFKTDLLPPQRLDRVHCGGFAGRDKVPPPRRSAPAIPAPAPPTTAPAAADPSPASCRSAPAAAAT